MQLQAMEFMAEKEQLWLMKYEKREAQQARGISNKMREEVQGFERVPREVKRMPKEAVMDGCWALGLHGGGGHGAVHHAGDGPYGVGRRVRPVHQDQPPGPTLDGGAGESTVPIEEEVPEKEGPAMDTVRKVKARKGKGASRHGGNGMYCRAGHRQGDVVAGGHVGKNEDGGAGSPSSQCWGQWRWRYQQGAEHHTRFGMSPRKPNS